MAVLGERGASPSKQGIPKTSLDIHFLFLLSSACAGALDDLKDLFQPG